MNESQLIRTTIVHLLGLDQFAGSSLSTASSASGTGGSKIRGKAVNATVESCAIAGSFVIEFPPTVLFDGMCRSSVCSEAEATVSTASTASMVACGRFELSLVMIADLYAP
jgi:hypothetical protein